MFSSHPSALTIGQLYFEGGPRAVGQRDCHAAMEFAQLATLGRGGFAEGHAGSREHSTMQVAIVVA